MTPDQELELMRMQADASARAKRDPTPGLSQMNRGIAETVGGAVDFLNPLTPVTGSAVDGIASGMRSIGVRVADEPPQGAGQGAMRGAGNAAGALLPGAAAFRGAAAFSGVVGAAAKSAYTALLSKIGIGTELAAGGAAGAAETATREAGYGTVAQTAAALAAGVAAPAAVIGTPRLMAAGAAALPVARGIRTALTPYTEQGAQNVARQRVQGLAGGPDRAQELSRRIDPDSPLTPAQQTEDPALLGLQRSAADANPALGDRLQRRDQGNIARIRAEVESLGQGGNIADTRAAVEQRRTIFRDGLKAKVGEAMRRAQQQAEAVGPQRTETDNSVTVAQEIRRSLTEAQELEGRLWSAVPRDARVPTEESRAATLRIIAQTPRSQEQDIPRSLLRFLGRDGEYGPTESVNEMHGLYSALREEARNAMAGNNQNRNRARIANEAAEAILRDLGTGDPSSEVGRSINVARDFSAELHRTFDQGATGRLLRRTVNADEQIPPELTLDRTLSRGGAAADTAFDDMNRAVGTTNDVDGVMRDAVEDYLKRRFTDAAFPEGADFSQRGAATFMRNNRELLSRFPELRVDFARAAQSREAANALARRAETVGAAAADPRRSAGARFVESPEGREIDAILSARDPSAAAREIVRQARGDTSGRALGGLKRAFAEHLIAKSTPNEGIRSVTLREMMRDPRVTGAMRQVFSNDEMIRFNRISDELGKIEAAGRAVNVGGVSNVTPPRWLTYVLTTFAARSGARAGGGVSGASMKTANIASNRAREIIENLTNDRAARIITEAIEDPRLFQLLLTDPASRRHQERIVRSLAPFVTGGSAAAMPDRQPEE